MRSDNSAFRSQTCTKCIVDEQKSMLHCSKKRIAGPTKRYDNAQLHETFPISENIRRDRPPRRPEPKTSLSRGMHFSSYVVLTSRDGSAIRGHGQYFQITNLWG